MSRGSRAPCALGDSRHSRGLPPPSCCGPSIPISPAACESIRYLSTATVVFAFPREAIGHDLKGTGFVVPRAEASASRPARGFRRSGPSARPRAKRSSARFWAARAIRTCSRRPIPSCSRAALADLTKILDIRGLPTLTRVYRWNHSSPQQEVGHARPRSTASTRGSLAIPGCLSRQPAFAASAFPIASPTRADRRHGG